MLKLNKLIYALYPARLDESIPDGDKEAAYELGYEDAISDVSDIVNHFKSNYPNTDPLEREEGE